MQRIVAAFVIVAYASAVRMAATNEAARNEADKKLENATPTPLYASGTGKSSPHAMKDKLFHTHLRDGAGGGGNKK